MFLNTKLKTNIQNLMTSEYFPSLRCIQSEFSWVHYSSSKFLLLQIINLGQVVWELVYADPGLKVNQSFKFFLTCIKMFLTYFWNILRFIKLTTEEQTIIIQ